MKIVDECLFFTWCFLKSFLCRNPPFPPPSSTMKSFLFFFVVFGVLCVFPVEGLLSEVVEGNVCLTKYCRFELLLCL